MTQLGTHMAFPAYHVEDWEAVTQGTGLLPDPTPPPSPMHCDLQRFPTDHTLANTLWLTQLSSLLTPKVTACHILSLHWGILSLLQGILSPPEMLPPRPLHLLVSSEVQAARLHPGSTNVKTQIGTRSTGDCRHGSSMADQSVCILLSLVGPGADEARSDHDPLPPAL